jgi:serine/threonine-protein kinase
MAEVYLAVLAGPRGFNKLQVLKILRADLPEVERADFVQMFRDEARLAARLNHPNIVQSHEVGSEDGHEFIAMEYLDGQPLSRVQQRGWPSEADLPLEMQLFVLCHVLEGLEYAHALTDYDETPMHIVHRDVSPQNVFITYAGQTKLVDFGIAKTLESCQTRAGVVKGKAHYMAPEQVLGRRIDNRADLFSTGIMLWEAIARRRMHESQSVYEIMRRLVKGDLPAIRDVVPDVPDELERIVTRAIAHEPDDRYPSASAFSHDLASFLETYRRVGTKAVGERIAQLFADERRAINEVIRQAMADAAQADSTDAQSIGLLPNLHALAASTGSGMTRAPDVAEAAAEPSTTPTTAPVRYTSMSAPVNVTPLNNPASRRSSRLRFFAVVAAIAAVAAAVLLLVRWRPATPATVDAIGAAKPSTPNASVHVKLRAFPSHAAMTIDGRPVKQNPYEADHPRDDGDHSLEVQAPGYAPRTVQIRLDRDLDLEVRLSEVPVSGRSDTPRKPAAVARPTRAPARRAAPPAAHDGPKTNPDEIYEEFRAPKRSNQRAPALDTSDPWGAE